MFVDGSDCGLKFPTGLCISFGYISLSLYVCLLCVSFACNILAISVYISAYMLLLLYTASSAFCWHRVPYSILQCCNCCVLNVVNDLSKGQKSMRTRLVTRSKDQRCQHVHEYYGPSLFRTPALISVFATSRSPKHKADTRTSTSISRLCFRLVWSFASSLPTAVTGVER